MNEKKARQLRRMANYDSSADPVEDRRHASVVCTKAVGRHKGKILRAKTGKMLVCKYRRRAYRYLKKQYKLGML